MFDIYVRHHARRRPSAPAVLSLDGPISFAKLDADVTRTADLLRQLPAGADRPVAIDLDSPYLTWLVTLAFARLGVPSAPRDDHACPLRVADRADADPAFLIGEREMAAMLSGPVPALPQTDVAPDAMGRILLTSGTTGAQKRIALSWRMIDASIRNVPFAYGPASGPWLTATGIHTIFGFVLTLGCWGLGLPVLLPDRPLTIAQMLVMRPGLIAMTPGQLADLVDQLPEDYPKFPVRVVTAGGAVPAKVIARTRAVLTDDILSVYGASECGAVAIASPALQDRSPAAAGYVLPGVTVRIVDDQGADVAPGEVGHVRIRSDRLASFYLDGETGPFRDGFFCPGDLGRLDAQGLLRLDGRADDIMNLRGQKVLPAWVEAAVQPVPGVLESAAFSLVDADGWERCWIAVAAGEGFSEEKLVEALKRPLFAVETISWLVMDRLPRNAMGKIERNRLRDHARALGNQPARRLG